ncbi:PREDICTED: neuronal PAS domain-containing protein 1 [Galeopterus variegatus]|uniref:Neuronal PAS domain-containing protein 1 n=1 Tax=Galeopterus variegatus TaxID=482537 RepID=A0ABM0RN09_GALVR|nr:PREDICTED: neuronal PAS domain-containing protein 1 [Galeopterus variegatus]
MAAPYPSRGGGGAVKCRGGLGASVPWDVLPGLVVKTPPGPCLQAQRKEKSRNAARSRPPSRRGPAALVTEVFEQHLGGHILQSLDGFVFALNQEGKFLYISETVSIYLGLSQVELTGSSVFDYIHPGDHSEVLEQLGLRAPNLGPSTPPSVSSSSSSSSLVDTPEIEASPTQVLPTSRVQERSFFIRMKSTLTKRGLHVKASGYKVIHVTGRLRARALGLVALGHTLPPAPLAELPLHGHMIVFRLSLGLTILACESRVSDHMDLGPSELVGRSCYQFVHGQDATRIRQSHLDLLDKGQVMTGYYRWLQRAGGFVWLQSVATVAGSGKNPGEHHVLWVSHVLSQAEGGQTPLDAFQLPASMACEDVSSPGPEPTEPEPPVGEKQAAPPDENEASETQGKRIKLEPGPRETKDSEDSGDEELSSHPASPRPEFTSVIRAGALKRAPVQPWGLAPAGDPAPALLHAGFLPPVVRGLCAPSTIRYGPTELGLMYPHLQRLGPAPPLPEAFYPTLGLPYPGHTGTRGQRKED